MLQYSTYSVISPEGCASILWKSQDKKEAAAEALEPHRRPAAASSACVDEVIEEPLGGAHRDPAAMAARLKAALVRHLDELEAIPRDELRAQRAAKIASFGVFSESRRLNERDIPRSALSDRAAGSRRRCRALARAAARTVPRVALCVAFSGGVDSTRAARHALARARAGAGSACCALLHVDHGLQPAARELGHALPRAGAHARACHSRSSRRQVARARGESLEAAARDARYALLASALAAGRGAADRPSRGRSARDGAAAAVSRRRRCRARRDAGDRAVRARLARAAAADALARRARGLGAQHTS